MSWKEAPMDFESQVLPVTLPKARTFTPLPHRHTDSKDPFLFSGSLEASVGRRLIHKVSQT